ncbi:aspartyl-phosphate phosphatase Spo0E family protein [Bacillus sp. CGMCC 1.16607]|uniref:aspartyl-phosphate phosphatase Spo0E family protein n=1 Tax=Bacillus sp. CGMCC 1.16607 TaxID=3351842 RepID=UPI003627BA8F
MCLTEKKHSNRMLDEINKVREIMMKSAAVTGFTSDETIHYSQELDKLIYEYQCTFRREQKNTKDVKITFTQMLIWPRASLTSEIIYI